MHMNIFFNYHSFSLERLSVSVEVSLSLSLPLCLRIHTALILGQFFANFGGDQIY